MRRYLFAGVAAVALGVAGFGQGAQAALLFETNAQNGTSIGRDEFGIATRITVAAPTALTNIGVQLDLLSATGNLNFFIFNSVTGALLFETGSQAFADDGNTFKVSGAFSFTLNPGVTYAIGAVTDVAANYAYDAPGGRTQNGITSLGGNQNAAGFLTPTLNTDLAGTDGVTRLYGGDVVAVPEPASLALLGLGLLGLGAVVRRRG